jgi:hypothetical protein
MLALTFCFIVIFSPRPNLGQGYFIAGIAPSPFQAEKNNIPLLPIETIHSNRIVLLF